MIIDNCPAHPNIKDLRAIKLIFLPPSTTSKTPPMDQGVIQSLKVHYRKLIILRHVKAIDHQQEAAISVLESKGIYIDDNDTESTYDCEPVPPPTTDMASNACGILLRYLETRPNKAAQIHSILRLSDEIILEDLTHRTRNLQQSTMEDYFQDFVSARDGNK
ncbi:uncharacterized protein LOC110460147 [Mizuhopecten yessoensis]|uniref:uncharacterized protein LOC110460147 n=1 Tax=Mizuhopecten yessoensis TaxID=6573 RepID=UPI000B45D71D|nr:uncharacterized protein LOC110460147 [Mizuhopecten yessoensis]